MRPWFNIALAAKLAKGSRRTELQALLAAKPAPAQYTRIIAATPRRFVSLPKLLKPNAAIDAMLRTFRATMDVASEQGLAVELDLSDTPNPPHAPALYLSHHTIESSAFAALRAKGTRVMHFKAADLPGRTSVDPMGFAGWSSVASQNLDQLDMGGVSTDQINTFFESLKAEITGKALSKYAQSQTLESLPERFVFVALQTIDDMVQRNAFMPMLDMLDAVVARFENSGYTVVVKRHPKCRSRRVRKALHAVAQRPHVAVTEASIHQLMHSAQAVFTVNSGVGAEALVYETPIYCFGKADYSAVAHEIRCEADLGAATTPIRPACSVRDLRRFVYFYRNIYQFRQEDELYCRIRALIADSVR